MKKTTLLFLVLILLFLDLRSQDESINLSKLKSYIQNVEAFNQLNPQEKVYLHFDNTGYFLGETIWFKAYVVNALEHRPNPLSRVLYVELLAPNGEIIQSKKLKIEEGQCHGEFYLNNQYLSGYYEIRAYTRYMLNFKNDCFFSRVFPVINRDNLEDIQSEKDQPVDKLYPLKDRLRKPIPLSKKEKIYMHFYPEGGNLIKDISSRVAFKITDENGKGINIQGKLFNKSKKLITDFQSVHQGMGVFQFTPVTDKYYAEIRYNGKSYKFDLPKYQLDGYILGIERKDSDSVIATLRGKKKLLTTNTLGLVVIGRGQVSWFQEVDTSVIPDYIKIPVKDLTPGVNRFALINNDGMILSDRLFFIDQENNIEVNITQNKNSYLPYEKVNMDLSLRGLNIDTEVLTFSLAIRSQSNNSYIPDYDDIRINLLLESELKGYVENPSYYFNPLNKEKEEALDLLMMVQGWTRYSWEHSAGLKPFLMLHPKEECLIMRGRILSKLQKNPLPGITVSSLLLSFNNDDNFWGHYITGSNGEFIFSSEEFTGNRYLSLIAKVEDRPVNVRITLDRQFTPAARPYSVLEISDLKNTIPLLVNQLDKSFSESITHMQYLKEVTISGNKFEPNKVFNVEEEVNYYLDMGMDLPYKTPLEYMKFRDPKFGGPTSDLKIFKYKETPGALIFYGLRGIWKNKKEEGEASVSEVFTRRNIEDIKSIIVTYNGTALQDHKRRFPHSYPKDYIGIIIVPFEVPVQKSKGTRFTRWEGYSETKEFYAVDYKENPPIPGEIDERRTLYWNPNVKADENGKVSVNFYNNSLKGNFVVSVAGISKEGIPLIKK